MNSIIVSSKDSVRYIMLYMLLIIFIVSCNAQTSIPTITRSFLDDYKLINEVPISENDSTVIRNPIYKVVQSPNGRRIMIITLTGQMFIADKYSGDIQYQFQSKQWMNDSLCLQLNTNPYRGDNYHSSVDIKKIKFIPADVYQQPVFSNKINNGLFVSDSVVLLIGSFYAVATNISRPLQYEASGAAGIAKINLNSNSININYFDYHQGPPYPIPDECFVYDHINHNIILSTMSHQSDGSNLDNLDSAWAISTYSLEGKRLYNNMILPSEYRKFNIGYVLTRGCGNIDSKGQIWVSFGLADKIFNITNNSNVDLQFNDINIEFFAKKTITDSTINSIPIIIEHSVVGDEIWIVALKKNIDSVNAKTYRSIQKYSTSGEMLESSILPNFIRNCEIKYVIPYKKELTLLCFHPKQGWRLFQYEHK